MASFLILATLVVLAALAWVLRPLWRQSPRFVLAAIALLGLATGSLYLLVGNPAGLRPAPVRAQMPRDIDAAIVELRAALQRDPRQVEGWMLLGRALLGQEKYAEASEAFGHAVRLQPDHPEVLVSAAQARMLAAGNQLDATAMGWLQQALRIQPEHQRARWFLGVAQRQAGQPAQAAATWEPLLAQVDASTAASLLPQVNAARAEAGQPPLSAPAATDRTAPLVVEVALDPKWRTRMPGDTTVFVIARVPDGPPMPVAVEKHRLDELPLRVELDDGDSPMPTAKLSTLAEVEVLARLSPSGNAIPREGDVSSAPLRVKLTAADPVELTVGE